MSTAIYSTDETTPQLSSNLSVKLTSFFKDVWQCSHCFDLLNSLASQKKPDAFLCYRISETYHILISRAAQCITTGSPLYIPGFTHNLPSIQVVHMNVARVPDEKCPLLLVNAAIGPSLAIDASQKSHHALLTMGRCCFVHREHRLTPLLSRSAKQ